MLLGVESLTYNSTRHYSGLTKMENTQEERRLGLEKDFWRVTDCSVLYQAFIAHVVLCFQ